MIKIFNKTSSVLVLGNHCLQPGLNYIQKSVYDSFWTNGLMNKLLKASEEGKVEIQE